ncbi:hypothetical protein NPIL_494651 [Nephila pilipes]|uniref:Uncharacterized protein n=1 Tax=Nephila pilipes TaxID=299642 RepID=A0A8X6T484_NEPPI|nr:hypothetical protein NPIL_494651 [Nephila pilipes]
MHRKNPGKGTRTKVLLSHQSRPPIPQITFWKHVNELASRKHLQAELSFPYKIVPESILVKSVAVVTSFITNIPMKRIKRNFLAQTRKNAGRGER